jgi:transcriptional antiterminator NusG
MIRSVPPERGMLREARSPPMGAKRWYVVHVYSGFEKKIAEQIKHQAAQSGLADRIDDILVPTEQVTEVRRGQKVDTERKFFPGYVLVKMDLDDETWHLVRDTPKVTGFLGARNKPQPIPEARRCAWCSSSANRPRSPSAPPCCSRSASR